MSSGTELVISKEPAINLVDLSPELHEKILQESSAVELLNLKLTCRFFHNNNQLEKALSEKPYIKSVATVSRWPIFLSSDDLIYRRVYDAGGNTFKIFPMHDHTIRRMKYYSYYSHRSYRGNDVKYEYLFLMGQHYLSILGFDTGHSLGIGKESENLSNSDNIAFVRKQVLDVILFTSPGMGGFFLCTDGLWAWGEDIFRELGISHKHNKDHYKKHAGKTDEGFKYYRIDKPLRVSIECDFIQLSVLPKDYRTYFKCGVKTFVCGLNESGQAGVGHNKLVKMPTETWLSAHGYNVKQVETTVDYTCFACDEGPYDSLFVCGKNIPGFANAKPMLTPTKLPGLENRKILKVEIHSSKNAIFIHCDDGLHSFGDNSKGIIGIKGSYIEKPTRLTTPAGFHFTDIKLTPDYTYLISSNGEFFGCGSIENVVRDTPVKLLSNNNITHFITCERHVIFAATDGTYYLNSQAKTIRLTTERVIKIKMSTAENSLFLICANKTFICFIYDDRDPLCKELVHVRNKNILDTNSSLSGHQWFGPTGYYESNKLIDPDKLESRKLGKLSMLFEPSKAANPPLPTRDAELDEEAEIKLT